MALLASSFSTRVWYIEETLRAKPLLAVAWYSPMAIASCFIVLLGCCIFHRLSDTHLLICAGTVWIVAPLMFTIVLKMLLIGSTPYHQWNTPPIGIGMASNCREQFHHNVIAAVPAGLGWRLIQFDQCDNWFKCITPGTLRRQRCSLVP